MESLLQLKVQTFISICSWSREWEELKQLIEFYCNLFYWCLYTKNVFVSANWCKLKQKTCFLVLFFHKCLRNSFEKIVFSLSKHLQFFYLENRGKLRNIDLENIFNKKRFFHTECFKWFFCQIFRISGIQQKKDRNIIKSKELCLSNRVHKIHWILIFFSFFWAIFQIFEFKLIQNLLKWAFMGKCDKGKLWVSHWTFDFIEFQCKSSRSFQKITKCKFTV